MPPQARYDQPIQSAKLTLPTARATRACTSSWSSYVRTTSASISTSTSTVTTCRGLYQQCTAATTTSTRTLTD